MTKTTRPAFAATFPAIMTCTISLAPASATADQIAERRGNPRPLGIRNPGAGETLPLGTSAALLGEFRNRGHYFRSNR